MFEDKTRVLLVIPRDLLDRARVFAGSATTKFKRAVSLQMVLRAFIDEGLKRDGDRAVLANVEDQIHAIPAYPECGGHGTRGKHGKERTRTTGRGGSTGGEPNVAGTQIMTDHGFRDWRTR